MNRYPSYKESGVEWMGEIPSGWNIKPLYSHFSHNKLKNDDSTNTILSLSYGRLIERDVERNFGLLPESFESYQLLQEGDIILRMTDLQNDKRSLRVGFCDFKGIITSVYIGLRPKKMIYSKYYYSYLHFCDIKKVFYGLGGGIRQSVTYNDFKRFPIPSPPLQEQQQISNYLDHKTQQIDSLIEKTQQKIELLKEQRISLINQVVTKGLNPDVEMKDSGVEWIGEIPSGWILIKLHTLISIDKIEFQDGNHGGEHPNPEEYEESGVPFIKPKDIQNGKINWEQCDRLPFDRCERFRIGFSNNDDVLLVNRGGSIGKVCYVSDFDENFSYFVINPQVTYIRGKKGLLSKYLYYISLSNIFQCGIDLILGHGSTFPFLGLSNMGNFEIVFPVTIEQQQIVDHLDKETSKIDSTIEKETQRIDLLKEYRQSLISNVVTGKVDVRDEVLV